MIAHSIHRISIVINLAVLLAVLLASPTSAAPRERARYIVVFKDTVRAPANLARAQTEQRDAKLGFVYRHALKGYSATLSQGQVEGLRNDPHVEFVAPDREVEAFAQATPTGIDRTFAAANFAIDIDEQDDARADVNVAVIDTGVDYDHPDLNVVARTDCSNGTEEEAQCEDESGDDFNGHGTHVAGTISAIDNGKGVVGVAPGARIWAVKVLGTGINYDSEVAAGVDWVTATREDEDPNNDIYVVNMSLGCGCPLPATATAISGSVSAGVVHVVAAGNSAANVKNFAPANHPDVIAVTALADFDGKPSGQAGANECRDRYELEWGAHTDDSLAAFSNWGEAVDVAAPGVCILSTTPGGNYGEVGWWGTSMASPHVAGAAALLAVKEKPYYPSDVSAIRETIEANGNFDWEDTSGDGIQEPLLDVANKVLFGIIEFPPLQFSHAFGEKGSGNGQLNQPFGIAIDSEGNIWATDRYNYRVQKFNSEGEYLDQFGERGSGNGQFEVPTSITIDSEDNIWVVDNGNRRVQKFNSEGEYLDQFGEAGTGDGQFGAVYGLGGIAIDAEGSIWVGDRGNFRVQKFNSEGEYLDQFGEAGTGDGQFGNGMFGGVGGIMIDSEGNIWVADGGNSRVQKFNSEGEYLDQFGEAGTHNGQFWVPIDIDIDPEGDLYVADMLNSYVGKFNPEGEYLGRLGGQGSGQSFAGPAGVAGDPEGNLWVVDSGNHRIQKWSVPPPSKPLASTDLAAAINTESAILSASIDPERAPTTYQFEYGKTTAYGSTVPIPAEAIGSGDETVAVEELIEGLQPNTTYHFRIVATNEVGTTQGQDRKFMTPPE